MEAIFGMLCRDPRNRVQAETLTEVASLLGVPSPSVLAEGGFGLGLKRKVIDGRSQKDSIAVSADRSVWLAMTGEIEHHEVMLRELDRAGRPATGTKDADALLGMFLLLRSIVRRTRAGFLQHRGLGCPAPPALPVRRPLRRGQARLLSPGPRGLCVRVLCEGRDRTPPDSSRARSHGLGGGAGSCSAGRSPHFVQRSLGADCRNLSGVRGRGGASAQVLEQAARTAPRTTTFRRSGNATSVRCRRPSSRVWIQRPRRVSCSAAGSIRRSW